MGRLKNGLLGVLGNAYGGRSLEQMALADSHAPDGNPLVLHMSLPGELIVIESDTSTYCTCTVIT